MRILALTLIVVAFAGSCARSMRIAHLGSPVMRTHAVVPSLEEFGATVNDYLATAKAIPLSLSCQQDLRSARRIGQPMPFQDPWNDHYSASEAIC